MISDTLAEAIDEIKEYMKGLDFIYAGRKKELDDLLARMKWMRRELDNPLPTMVKRQLQDIEDKYDWDKLGATFRGLV